MRPAGTIHLKDAETGEEAYVFVRARAGLIALAVSLQTGGEAEVFMRPDELEQLQAALRQAAAVARAGT